MATGAERGRTVTRWTGIEVRALRVHALRRTQEELAELTGFSVNTIGKWERRGATINLAGQFAAGMDTVLRRLDRDQLQRFEAALPDVSPDFSGATSGHPMILTNRSGDVRTADVCIGEVEDDVKRREFGTAIFAMAAVGMATSGKAVGRLGVADAFNVRAVTERFEQQDQHVGSGTLLEAAYRQLEQAKLALETSDFSETSGNALMSATGNLAVLVGWLAYDAEKHPLARSCYADAMALANVAADDELTIHTCLYMALQSVRLSRNGIGSPHHALRMTTRAKDLTHGLPSGRLHALVAVREATAWGLLGERAAFKRSIATAWREMDRAAEHEPVDSCPVWLQFMSHAEVEFQEAQGLGDLGNLDQSIELHNNVLNRHTGARNSANYRSRLAATLAARGDTHQAVFEAMPILGQLETSVSSPRTVQNLGAVRRAVDTQPSAEEFRRRFDEIAAAHGVTV